MKIFSLQHFLFTLAFCAVFFFYASPTHAVGEICADDATCCTPPQIIQDGGGCPPNTYWIGSDTGGSCQSSATTCGATQFNCMTGTCTSSGSGTAPTCNRSTEVHIGNNVCADWIKIIRDDDADTTYDLWFDEVLGQVLYQNPDVTLGNNGNLIFKATADDPGDIIFQNSAGTQKGRIWSGVSAGVNELYLSSDDNTADITIDADGHIKIPGNIIFTGGNNEGSLHAVDEVKGYNDLRFYGDTSGGPDMKVMADGKIGMGTVGPSQKLTVIGAIRGANETAETNYIQIGHGGSNAYIAMAGAGNLDFRVGGTAIADTKLKITPGGSLQFPNFTSSTKNSHIRLWDNGNDNYGFGIDSNTLNYVSDKYHKFWGNPDSTEPTFIINGDSDQVALKGDYYDGCSLLKTDADGDVLCKSGILWWGNWAEVWANDGVVRYWHNDSNAGALCFLQGVEIYQAGGYCKLDWAGHYDVDGCGGVDADGWCTKYKNAWCKVFCYGNR